MNAWENVPHDPLADDEQLEQALLAEEYDWTAYDFIIAVALCGLGCGALLIVGWVIWEILR